jgi:hypothetical protein
MAGTRVVSRVSLTAGTRTPIYTGPVIAAASFSILNGVATIVLASALPATGYNPPSYDSSHSGGPPAGGQQVVLWGFTTANGLQFNGRTVSVIANNPALNSFSFNWNASNVGSTSDAGNTAPIPVEQYRSVRLECDQSDSTNKVYVGDLNVSSSQYAECLSLAGQIAVTIASGTIPADRIFCDTSATGTYVQVSLMY